MATGLQNQSNYSAEPDFSDGGGGGGGRGAPGAAAVGGGGGAMRMEEEPSDFQVRAGR